MVCRLVGQVVDSAWLVIEAMNIRSAALAWLGAFSAVDLNRLQEEIHARGCPCTGHSGRGRFVPLNSGAIDGRGRDGLAPDDPDDSVFLSSSFFLSSDLASSDPSSSSGAIDDGLAPDDPDDSVFLSSSFFLSSALASSDPSSSFFLSSSFLSSSSGSSGWSGSSGSSAASVRSQRSRLMWNGSWLFNMP